MRGDVTEDAVTGRGSALAVGAAAVVAFVVTLVAREGLYRLLAWNSGNATRSFLLDAAFIVLAGEVFVWYGALAAPASRRAAVSRKLATCYGALCVVAIVVLLYRADFGFAIAAVASAAGAIYAARSMQDNPTLAARRDRTP
jgi:hypothetical protein